MEEVGAESQISDPRLLQLTLENPILSTVTGSLLRPDHSFTEGLHLSLGGQVTHHHCGPPPPGVSDFQAGFLGGSLHRRCSPTLTKLGNLNAPDWA